MNKKFFIGLFLFSLVLLSGGCGGSSHSSVNNANSALDGAWTSSTNGSATIADTSELEEVDALIKAFNVELTELMELSEDLRKEYNALENNKITANVTKAMAVFEDCDVSKDNGSAKLTAIIIISGDTSFWPIVFNGVTLTTQPSGTNGWTATLPNDAGILTISMASNEKMTLSGTVKKYLGYDCEFSTEITKNSPNSLDPNTILNGTWRLDGTQSGCYLAEDSEIIAAAATETASIFFSGDSQLDVKSFYSLRMRTSSVESQDETSLLQNISESSGTLTKINGNAYRFKESDGSESVIFVENIDEIFAFMLESEDKYESCMFLPLKKVSVDIGTALAKTWTATKGGGYADSDDTFGACSFSLESATLIFSNVTSNDNEVTAKVDIDASFSFANEKSGIKATNVSIPIKGEQSVTMTRSGNFLQFTNDDYVYKISFVSDTEAFLSITPASDAKTGELVMRFNAN